jgi:2-amino-4-hydroxy-6-hydroxymethyldihydropteridine diphosphokinase
MKRVVLGLGSNLGNRRENLSNAADAIERLPGTTVIASSGIYETRPFDVPGQQNDYLNQCVVALTELSPRALLGACLGIEVAMGRVRKEKHGSRTIDIDLLLYEGVQCKDGELVLPHPGIRERAFVLVPLADLFPDKNALGLDFSAAFKRIDRSEIKNF